MKKKIFGGIAVLAIAAMAAFNVNMNTQNDNLSDLSLANVEALAQSEGGSSSSNCCPQKDKICSKYENGNSNPTPVGNAKNC